MSFDFLPARTDSAATNMATDFLMLQHYPTPAHARFRSYGWQRPAFTFGYSQKIAWVREQIGHDGADAELCRRPTGGGIVDHRNDWTYALVIPPGHPLFADRAVASYEAVHRVLATTLQGLGTDARLKESCDPDPACAPVGPGVCFDRAERFDVVHATTGRKIAGAAQKRSKRGLLFQGSLSRAELGRPDDDALAEAFPRALASMLGLEVTHPGWPELWDDSIDALAENYASPEWNERR
ncbi:lipoate--protein ligase family protein [Synoicihabitans lomoniglobus]|uniref:Lipoate--protein ligase family protein n=1 Tax=Synoicihabitans lomoniglobus TaxID=2909285 RepID=A0AAE9ZW85_9BACT|nr:lipoate--protein ligase family protein [Opitutaceae bacterium LMO-M01]WED64556.1 lipoate--protein ligase family protein [Opitutaceae bacterium LMO-M01]